jgi:hypothetical protein
LTGKTLLHASTPVMRINSAYRSTLGLSIHDMLRIPPCLFALGGNFFVDG